MSTNGSVELADHTRLHPPLPDVHADDDSRHVERERDHEHQRAEDAERQEVHLFLQPRSIRLSVSRPCAISWVRFGVSRGSEGVRRLRQQASSSWRATSV